MARRKSTEISSQGRSNLTEAWSASPEARQRIIGEAAYYRYVHRGFVHGHDLDDWLASEAEFERESPGRQPHDSSPIQESGVQQGGARAPREDEALKRDIKQHPRRDISRIESMEPEDAPLKE